MTNRGSLSDFINLVKHEDLEVNTLNILHDGMKSAQYYRPPYKENHLQLLFSLTKSFTSIAVGIAWDSGYFGPDDKVVSFFPDKLPDSISSNLKKMTVHHLLSMSTGHAEHHYFDIYPHKDWVKAFLAIPPETEPGTYYCYSTHASHVLAAIVERTTGQNLIEFLRQRLFGALGISDFSWETGPDGVTAGGMGLSIPAEGIAAFGQMLLNNGIYGGRRIVSEEYIRLATSKHSDTIKETRPEYYKLGYGYQFNLYRQGCFGHNGSFGQLCFISPNDRLVIATTSRKRNTHELLSLIFENIISQDCDDSYWHMDEYVDGRVDDCDKPDEHQVMSRTRASDLSVQDPFIDIPRFSNAVYTLGTNPDNLDKLRLSSEDTKLHCEFIYEKRENRHFTFSFAEPVQDRDIFVKDISLHEQEVVLYADWIDRDTLELKMVYVETPYVAKYTIVFNDDAITLYFSVNVSLGDFSPNTKRDYSVKGKLAE